MIETRKESSSTSEQVWLTCPACDTIKMQTQPRQSSAVMHSEDGIDDANAELAPDLHEAQDSRVSPLSYSGTNN